MRTTTLTTPLGNDASGEPTLLFYQLKGREALNTLFDYTLTMYSDKADIAPSTILGQPVTICIQDQYGNSQYLNAIVAEFKYISVDVRRHEFEAKTAYEAKLVPWLALAKYSHDCKIFQNMTIPQIVAEVLGKYPFPVKQNLQGKYETLVFTVQYNESDYAFVARLLERAGIGYHFSHSANGHTLVLTDSSLPYTTIAGHETVAYRGLDDSHSDVESISSMTLEQSIKTGLFSTGDYWYRQPYATFQQMDGGTYEAKNHPFDEQEIYHWHGQGHFHDWDVGANIAKINQDRQHNQFRVMQGECNVRAFVVGATGSIFTLQDHPRDDANKQLVILATETYIKESLSAAGDAGEHTDWEVKLTVMSEEYQYRPQHVTPHPKIPGPQTAIVTGPKGQEIWTNDLGEVKLRFLWDRYSSGDENSSCWVRVGSTWAGEGWGQNEIPRIGQEVIVIYLDGNPDNPLVISRVVNSSRMPPSFSNVGNLPGNQALAGIKSKELGGGRYNQLLMDDTTGEIKMQMESEHAKSQLNLGYLTQPRNNGSAEPRGEGAELRTDAWAAIRAAKGLLLSTDTRYGDDHLDTSGTTAQLDAALTQATAHSTMAHTHNADELEANESLSHLKIVSAQQYEQGRKNVAGYKEPIIAVTSPAGIAQTSQKAVVIAAGTDIHATSQLDTNLSVGRRLIIVAGELWSVFVEKAGIKLFAGKGKVQIQAQSDNMELTSLKAFLVQSIEERVQLLGKEILAASTPGGAYIRIAGENIDVVCPGTYTVKAANFVFAGPSSLPMDVPTMPKSDSKANEFFVLVNQQTGEPIANRRYKATTASGQVIEGVSDIQGKTQIAKSSMPENIEIKVYPREKT